MESCKAAFGFTPVFEVKLWKTLTQMFVRHGAGQPENSTSRHFLRPKSMLKPANKEVTVAQTEGQGTQLVVSFEEDRTAAVAKLRRMATSLGFSVKLNRDYDREFTRAVGARLINRWGAMIFQNVKFPLMNFTREATRALFPGVQPLRETTRELVFKFTTVDALVAAMGSKMSTWMDSSMAGGITKLCKPPSESAARAAATIMPPFQVAYTKHPHSIRKGRRRSTWRCCTSFSRAVTPAT